MYLKAFIENFRLDPAVSGYEWWLAWTYVGGSSGILGGNQDNPVAKLGIDNATIRSLQSINHIHTYIVTTSIGDCTRPRDLYSVMARIEYLIVIDRMIMLHAAHAFVA